MARWADLFPVAPNIRQEQWTELQKSRFLHSKRSAFCTDGRVQRWRKLCKRVGSSALVVPKGELWGLGACSTRRPFFFFSGLTTAHAAHRTWEKVNCEGPGASKLCFPDNKNLLGWLVASAGSVASEEGEPGKLGFTRAPGDSYHHGSWKNTFAKHHFIHLMDSTGVLRRQMRN